MRLTRLGGALLALAVPAAAQQPADPIAVLRAAQKIVPAATATIRYGADDLRSGELRLPVGKGPFPVAILIHGGCWTAAMETRAGLSPLAEALRERGIATWNIEYRRLGNAGGGWPGTFEDVAAAVDHLPALARRYPLDVKRVAIVGHSAGAHLAAWAAARGRLSTPWTARRVKPASVVVIDGPVSVSPFVGVDREVCGQPVIVPLMGGTPAERPDAYRIADAGGRLPFGMRQLLVLGSLGFAMTDYVAAAKKAGDPVETLAPAGADHFDIITPSTPNGRAVADWIAARAFAQ